MHYFLGIPTKSYKSGAWIIMAAMAVISCHKSSKSEEEMSESTTYYLEKVDSIRIDRENTVRLLDYHPIEDRFLAYDQITEEFLVLDGKGELLEAAYRVGEGPNEYNSSLLAASFNQEGSGYYLQSSGEFLRYNVNWQVEGRIRFASQVFIRFYSGPQLRVPYFRLQDASDPYFFTNFFSGVNNSAGVMDGEDGPDYLIELYNPQKEGLDKALPNDTELLPEVEMNPDSKRANPVQVFALDKAASRLFLTYDRSNEIGVYDMTQDFALEEMLNFEHQRFSAVQKARNTALFHFEPNLFAVLYFEGLSEAATEARKAKDPEYFSYRDPELYHLILIQDGVHQEEEIAFPASCEPHSEILLLPGKRLLLRDKYKGEDEPTYSTYSVFELKPVIK
ncbi:hypothetical protein [Cyclobacterium roseum]|uniref:hypothetical protein n=1 Tax=Cyclobacterium roseum TaxID=2666137 RepID=UPI001390C33D|nr:hypothetical protein [Cyclobacterium roseum]